MGSPTISINKNLTVNEMRRANPAEFNPIINARAIRSPLRMIHIFSVAKRSFLKRHMPLFPKLKLQGCEGGERWVRCCSFPDPIPQVCPDLERGGTRTDENDAWVAAVDLLAPGNFTMDPFAGSDNPAYFENASGTNLICEGVWPSANEEPTEEEIKHAEKMRDNRYRWLTGQATRLAATSTALLNEFLQTNPDTHIAMDALGLTASWHTHSEVKVLCPNCGDAIKQGIAFHQSSAGILCVLDPQRAFKAGAITRERMEDLVTQPLEAAKPKKG
jgi:hypothetical protein